MKKYFENFIYFRKNIFLCLVLGMTSGLPLALSGSSVVALLYEKGLNLSTIGFISLVSSVYSFKVLWSPFIDSFSIPLLTRKLGRRKLQILFIGIITSCVIIVQGFAIKMDNIPYIAFFALIVAICSASLDIVIDALRVEMLAQQEQSAGIATFTLGYKIAMVISGAGMFAISHYHGWAIAFWLIGVLMMILVIFSVLFISEADFHSQNNNWRSYIINSVVGPFRDIVKMHNIWLIVVFLIFFKLSDALLLSLISPFLLKIGFNKLEIAEVVKLYGMIASMVGGLFGGYISSFMSIRNFLFISLIMQMLSNSIYLVVLHYGYNLDVLIIATIIEYMCSGISAASLVMYISVLCNIKFTGSQYAFFSSITTLGRTTISSFSGVIVDNVGWMNFIILTIFASLPALLLLNKVVPKSEKTL